MNAYYFIYRTMNLVNGRFYVGMHVTTVLDDGYLGSGKAISSAIEKYGKENFKREVLFFCKDKEELEELEQKIITDKFIQSNKPLIYNMRRGGHGGTSYHTKDTRKRISESLRGKPSWNKGKHHSQDTKRKIGEKAKERWKDIGYKERVSEAFSRKIVTEEHKRNIGKSRLGKHHTEESKKKISESKVGKSRTEEARKKISDSTKGRVPWNKGKYHTKETRKKISDSKLKNKSL